MGFFAGISFEHNISHILDQMAICQGDDGHEITEKDWINNEKTEPTKNYPKTKLRETEKYQKDTENTEWLWLGYPA